MMCARRAAVRIVAAASYVLACGWLSAAQCQPSGGPAIGPSFQCPTPRDPLGQLICGSPLLARTDLYFVQAYEALRQQTPPDQRPALFQEAVVFGSTVRKDCGIGAAVDVGDSLPAAAPDTAISCVAAGYNQQRATWEQRLSGAAAQEAARPLEQHIALQRDLQVLGLLPAGDVVDGVYGPDTRNAIVSFQQAMGEATTGLLGDSDAAALQLQAAGNAAPPAPPASPARSEWDDFVAHATDAGLHASVPPGPTCVLSLEIRQPDALATATRSADREAGGTTPDDDGVNLFKAELQFLSTSFAAEALHAVYDTFPKIDHCTVRATGFTVDVYGRDVAQPLFAFQFDRATFDRIVWPRFDPANLPKIITSMTFGSYAQQMVPGLENRAPTEAASSAPPPTEAANPASPPTAPAAVPQPPSIPTQTAAATGVGLLRPNDGTDRPAAGAVGPPTEERTFIALVERASRDFDAAPNEMAKGLARANRAQEICAALRGLQATDWVGTVDTLSSTGSGKGVMAIRLSPTLRVETAETDGVDVTADLKTLIDPASALMATAVRLQISQPVVFSGTFAASDTDCFEETSLTQAGSMHAPEFLFHFTDVRGLPPP